MTEKTPSDDDDGAKAADASDSKDSNDDAVTAKDASAHDDAVAPGELADDAAGDTAGSPDTDSGEPTPATEASGDAPRRSRLPLLAALFATIVAVAAIGGVALQMFAEDGPDPLALDNQSAIEQLKRDLAATRSDIDETGDSLAELRDSSRAAGDAVDELQQTLNERLRPLEAVPGRLSSLESSLSALQGISSGLRDSWLLSEAEYYLQIANAQLQLARNPALARIALELADERLVSLGNPALTDVRRAIADERRQIEALEMSDIEGAALTIASLADAVETLPLESDVVRQDPASAAVAEDLSGIDRALATMKNSLSNAISIRRTDEAAKTLLPPDAAYFLQSNLMLQLQSARLAMLRGERTLFTQSLDDAAEWINEYYDTDVVSVQSALATIDDLKDTRFSPTMPDISRSLALLRQYIALSASERNAPVGNGPAQ